MSWVFVVSGTHSSRLHCHHEALWQFSNEKFHVAIGGNAETCFAEPETESSFGWAVVGMGIRRNENTFSLVTRDDWRALLTKESFDASSLDGHCVVLRWKATKLECFTDQLGLRTLYFAKSNDGICISTRLDWVAQTSSCSQLDFSALGSRWLLFNQFSYDSCVKGIERVGPGGHVAFENGRMAHSRLSIPWHPSFQKYSANEASEILYGLIRCLPQHRTTSLALSGGLDSRLLLALVSNGGTNLVAHSFGDNNDPDVQVAKDLASKLAIPHHHFNEPFPAVQSTVENLREFVAQSILTEPFTSFAKLRYAGMLKNICGQTIDGGFGEIARRQYFNRILTFGKGSLSALDARRVVRFMQTHRASIFTPEIQSTLEQGAVEAVDNALHQMPPPEEIGIENFADLLAVRTRVPNFGSPEQSRLDEQILNFMPLVQPSFLNAIFSLPIEARKNAHLYREIIRRRCPAITKLPLVKSGFTYRYGLTTNTSTLLIKLKSGFGSGYVDASPDMLLGQLREFILDLLNSSSAKTNPTYAYLFIAESVTKYYAGDRHLRNVLDWWLTFELWRQSLSPPIGR